jgi:hypothetical protein
MTHPEAGRNDHIHGDEDYRDVEKVDLYDVIFAIRDGTSTQDGLSHHDWIRRICDGDEITTIIRHIVKNRHKPEFAELTNKIEIAIEGWLN